MTFGSPGDDQPPPMVILTDQRSEQAREVLWLVFPVCIERHDDVVLPDAARHGSQPIDECALMSQVERRPDDGGIRENAEARCRLIKPCRIVNYDEARPRTRELRDATDERDKSRTQPQEGVDIPKNWCDEPNLCGCTHPISEALFQTDETLNVYPV